MLNKATLIGNVGKDPEAFGQQSKIAKFSLATTEKGIINGESKEFTEWHQITAYGKMADVVLQYVRKGAKLYIEGKIATKQWEDKRTGTKMYRTEIEARNLLFLGSSPQTIPHAESSVPAGEFGAGSYDNPDDLPY